MKYLCLMAVFIVSCTSRVQDRIQMRDSVTPAPVHFSFERDSLDEVYSNNIIPEFEASYKHTFTIDTSFEFKDTAFFIRMEYLLDSTAKVVVPKKYLQLYGLEEYVVYASYCNLTIEKNGAPFFQKRMDKRMFYDALDVPKKAYAVIYAPHMSIDAGKATVCCSVSIPLTDIGEGVCVEVDLRNGEMEVR
ncbi:hypothetical protein HNQ91_001780 [Filimonas zeae]|nr:hypothetical protein [Filimonas zeae]MDR6338729.1 hypothetical protein [Filimonas zeae]